MNLGIPSSDMQIAKGVFSLLSDLRIQEAPPTLRELALERMRAAILAQRFEPGARLVEREVGAQLGVSRSVVREVLRHLEAEGLVQTVPHQGPIVAKLDAQTAIQIYEIRGFLEANAAAAAAQKANDLDIAHMEQALADIGKLARYTIEMGGGIELLETALRTPPWQPMQVLSADEVRRLRLATVELLFETPVPQTAASVGNANVLATSTQTQRGNE